MLGVVVAGYSWEQKAVLQALGYSKMDKTIWIGYTRWLHKTQLNQTKVRPLSKQVFHGFYISAMAFHSLFWARTNRAILKCLSKHMVRVLFPSLTTQAAGMERLLENIAGTGFLLLQVQKFMTQTVGYASLPTNIWTETEIEYYKDEVSFWYTLPTDSLHNRLYFCLLRHLFMKNKHSY